jgi:hypothetical protein
MKRSRPILISVTLLVFLAGAWLLTSVQSLTPEGDEARAVQADRFGLEGVDRELFMAESEVMEESEALIGLSDYFYDRYLYPTYQFDNRWMVEAERQNGRMQDALPAGHYPAERNGQPIRLGTDAFTPLGPNPEDGLGAGGLHQGRINVVVIDPVSPSVAYLGSDGGGVWKTDNCCSADTSWRVVTDQDNLQGIAIGDLHIDPVDHNIVYAGTGDLRYGSFSFGSSGLLKSSDQGETWELLGRDVFGPFYTNPGTFPQYNSIGKVRVNPNNNQHIAVGTKFGVHFSYDGGTSWTDACVVNGTNNQRQDVTGMEFVDQGETTALVVAIGTRGTETTVQQNLNQNGANGIYRALWPSEGCPSAWTLLSTPDNGWPVGTGSGIPNEEPNGNILGRIDMAIAPSDPAVMYAEVQAVITDTHELLGVWRTGNYGATWTQVADNSAVKTCGTATVPPAPTSHQQNWYDQGVTIDPNNPDVVWMRTLQIFRSTDGGVTWGNTDCGGDDVHVDQHGGAYIPGSSSEILFTNDGGIYYSDNADTPNYRDINFVTLNDNFDTSAMEFYGGDITENFAATSNPGVVGGMQDNGSAVFQWDLETGEVITQAMWIERRGGDGMRSLLEPTSSDTPVTRLYMQSQNGSVGRFEGFTDTSGLNATGPWVASGERLSFIMPLDINRWGACPDSDGDGYGCENLMAGTYRIWESVTGAVPAPSQPPATAWYPNSPDLTRGDVPPPNGLADRAYVNQMSYAFDDDTIAIAGTNDGKVWFGFGMGQGITETATWVDLTDNNTVLPNRPILDVITSRVTTDTDLIGYAAVGGFSQNTPDQPGHVYQVTCTADCATFTWADKSGNLPNIPVDSIMINPNFPQQVYAGTDWGLYFTNDINADNPYWFRFAGLPHVMVWDLTVDRGYTALAVFTRSRGVYAWPLPDAPLPVQYSLFLPLIDRAGEE